MRKIDHQNAMKKAEYEDQLRQQAKERNMQRDLELAKRQEELKRRKSTFLPLFDEQLSVFHVLPFFSETIIFEQEEALKHEEQKAIIHAKAQVKSKAENFQ